MGAEARQPLREPVPVTAAPPCTEPCRAASHPPTFWPLQMWGFPQGPSPFQEFSTLPCSVPHSHSIACAPSHPEDLSPSLHPVQSSFRTFSDPLAFRVVSLTTHRMSLVAPYSGVGVNAILFHCLSRPCVYVPAAGLMCHQVPLHLMAHITDTPRLWSLGNL